MVLLQPVMLPPFRPAAERASPRAPCAAAWPTCGEGLVLGARNMIGIGVACASAGLIVGAITLTGMGLMMTDFVELVSAGNVLVMLLLTAFICLLIGAGVPTTANYILVATLMAPVIVELGARSGLVIPLIAVHLFVFYFGILADVTPPVGLASYAAAAISGDDPKRDRLPGHLVQPAHDGAALRLHLQPAAAVDRRAARGLEVVIVCVTGTVASLLFAAATMNGSAPAAPGSRSACCCSPTFLFFRPGLGHRPVRAEVRQRARGRHLQGGRRPERGRVAGGRHRRQRPRRRATDEDRRDPDGRGRQRPRAPARRRRTLSQLGSDLEVARSSSAAAREARPRAGLQDRRAASCRTRPGRRSTGSSSRPRCWPLPSGGCRASRLRHAVPRRMTGAAHRADPCAGAFGRAHQRGDGAGLAAGRSE